VFRFAPPNPSRLVFAGVRRAAANATPVDLTEITQLRHRLRAGRSGFAIPSARAQAVLLLSAFLLGAVLSALLFVGVWRHTAAVGDRAAAAQATAQRELAQSRQRATDLQRRIGRERVKLAQTRTQYASTAGHLAHLQQGATRLPGELQSVDSSIAALNHTTSTLQSELSALQAYLASAKASGLDPGFVAAQFRYLSSATRKMQTTIAQLQARVRMAAAAATSLSGGK
jgi:septal ring factor EnvC (AmiA/AmiB activator)